MTTLSNTAVPKYYGQFREKVLSGEIPVCRNIEMEMNRIDALIENPAIYYDGRAVEGVIYFVRQSFVLLTVQLLGFLTHSNSGLNRYLAGITSKR